MHWIQTYTGRKFYPLDPRRQDIDIRDIAHALSLHCRFNGHCQCFYSVAEHCVRVCDLLSCEAPKLALWGLLHDSAEAYLTDMPRPVKAQLPQFEVLEDRLLQVIVTHFGLGFPMPAKVREADDVLLATEARDVMGPPPEPWSFGGQPLTEHIEPMTASRAQKEFLARFKRLHPSA